MILDNCTRRAVICYITNSEGDVLAGKRLKDHNKGKDVYYLPGGGVEPEETLLNAVYRELKEEIDIDPDDIEQIKETNRNFLQEFTEPLDITIEYNQEKIQVNVSGQHRTVFDIKLKPNFKLKHTVYDEFIDIRFMNTEELKSKFSKPEQLKIICP